MTVLETDRLALRRIAPADAPFIVELLNDPDWLRYIGDRGVRTTSHAVDYIEGVLGPMYARHGFGLYLTELKDSREPIGMCGLIKRDSLEDVDLGFAFLPRYRGAGYAFEAADGVLRYAAAALGLSRVVAIATPENDRSARLLERLGFRFERMLVDPGDQTALRLFARSLPQAGAARSP